MQKPVEKREEFTKDPEFLQAQRCIHHLHKRFNIPPLVIFQAAYATPLIPATAFNKKLSPLETVVKYLKEEYPLAIKDIANILNRSIKTVWQAYNAASKKHPAKLDITPTETYLDPTIYGQRMLSILEATVTLLHQTYKLSLHEIAHILQRDDRTIWTVLHRARQKQARQKKAR